MAYTRKTRDEFQIQQYTGPLYGWEEVCCSDTRKEARQLRQEYRDNQPEYPVRIVKRRIKLSDDESIRQDA